MPMDTTNIAIMPVLPPIISPKTTKMAVRVANKSVVFILFIVSSNYSYGLCLTL